MWVWRPGHKGHCSALGESYLHAMRTLQQLRKRPTKQRTKDSCQQPCVVESPWTLILQPRLSFQMTTAPTGTLDETTWETLSWLWENKYLLSESLCLGAIFMQRQITDTVWKPHNRSCSRNCPVDPCIPSIAFIHLPKIQNLGRESLSLGQAEQGSKRWMASLRQFPWAGTWVLPFLQDCPYWEEKRPRYKDVGYFCLGNSDSWTGKRNLQ